MSADTLTITSRAFFERTKMKIGLSIVLGAASMMLLGFCASAGGEAEANSIYHENAVDSTTKDSTQALTGGYGFASFCYILASILMVSAAIYVSPLINGSNNERKMVKSPQEIDAVLHCKEEVVTPINGTWNMEHATVPRGVIFIAHGPVIWIGRGQTCVTISSPEAEYTSSQQLCRDLGETLAVGNWSGIGTS